MSPTPAVPPAPPATPVMERALFHWKSTAAGLVASGGVLYVVANSFGCTLPSDPAGWWKWVLAAAPAVIGALSKDH